MHRVITYGTFDLLHYGHINLLRRAKAQGDYLIVALSTDEFNWNQKHKKCYFSYEQRKALLEAIKNNRINAIIVKDLSRFGRNATETGRYLENLFPVWGVRLIAINDFYDTELKNGATDILMNIPDVWAQSSASQSHFSVHR